MRQGKVHEELTNDPNTEFWNEKLAAVPDHIQRQAKTCPALIHPTAEGGNRNHIQQTRGSIEVVVLAALERIWQDRRPSAVSRTVSHARSEHEVASDFKSDVFKGI